MESQKGIANANRNRNKESQRIRKNESQRNRKTDSQRPNAKTRKCDKSKFLKSIGNILMIKKTKAEIAIEKFNINKSLDFMYEKT